MASPAAATRCEAAGPLPNRQAGGAACPVSLVTTPRTVPCSTSATRCLARPSQSNVEGSPASSQPSSTNENRGEKGIEPMRSSNDPRAFAAKPIWPSVARKVISACGESSARYRPGSRARSGKCARVAVRSGTAIADASRATTRAHDERPLSVPITWSSARVRASDCSTPLVLATECRTVEWVTEPPSSAPAGSESRAAAKRATRSAASACSVETNAVVAGRVCEGVVSGSTSRGGIARASRSSRSRI